MLKKVNVYPVYPILTIRNPIYHTTLNMELGVGDIERCIFARAKVEEILPNGKLLVLNLKNYNKCNFTEEHTSNKSVVSLPETNNEESTIKLVDNLESESEEKETTDNCVGNLEAISPTEAVEEEQETNSEVEENLVVDTNNRKNKKNKR